MISKHSNTVFSSGTVAVVAALIFVSLFAATENVIEIKEQHSGKPERNDRFMIDVTKTILRLGTSLDKKFMNFGYVLIFFPSIFWYLYSFRESTIIGFDGKWDTYYFLAILSSTIFFLVGLAIIFGTRKTIEKRIGK